MLGIVTLLSADIFYRVYIAFDTLFSSFYYVLLVAGTELEVAMVIANKIVISP